MLASFPMVVNLVSDDLAACRVFYSEKLGLTVEDYQANSYLMLKTKAGARLFIYHKSNFSPSENTGASFFVSGLEKIVDQLTKKGIKFEQYDDPDGPQTDERGIAERSGEKAAWFRDPSGNIISLYESSLKI